MASNYNYNSKKSMICGNYTSTNGGTTAYINTDTIENIPITITSPEAVSIFGPGNNVIISTVVYSQNITNFSAVTYYKNAASGALNGGVYSGKINYWSLDNTALQSYKYNESSIIQAGTFTTVNGTKTITFPTVFNRAPCIVVCPTSTASFSGIISCALNFGATTSQFTVTSVYKDGNNNQDGGGYYSGSFNYIAVDNTAVINYLSNSKPIIQCGTVTVNGSTSKTFLEAFPTGTTVRVFCSPSWDSAAPMNLISYSISSVSITTFTITASSKDGRRGENGGGYYTGTFNFIAVGF
jgi:hypothetical protein